MFDDLTGLYDRMYLQDCLPREIARAHRYRRPFTLVLIDIDGFKDITTKWGQDRGELVLCHLADLMRRQFRQSDILARLEGDTYAVFLPECLLPDAERVSERFRKKVAASKLSLPDGRELKMTISIGVVQYYDGQKAEELLEKAQYTLHRAKIEGQNRVKAYWESWS